MDVTLTATQRLDRADDAVNAKNYAAALADYRWYFEQARPADPSRRCDIHRWRVLGTVYRPARVALLAWRDQCRDDLMGSPTGVAMTPVQVEAFIDMATVNKQLQDFDGTYQVFRTLHQRGQALPERCVDVALRAVIECKDYELAKQYVSDPAATIAMAVRIFNIVWERVSSESGAVRKAARLFTVMYCSNELQPILTTVNHTEGVVAAYDLLHRAVDDILDPRLRLKVRRLLHA